MMRDRLSVPAARVEGAAQARFLGRWLERAAERAGGAGGREQPPSALQARPPATGSAFGREQTLQPEERPDAPLDVDLTGHVGPAQTEFVGLPEDPTHGPW